MQATEACVDLALLLRKPWLVCPCCVFPKSFPDRMFDGRPVKTYPDFLAYLALKHPRVREAQLGFSAERDDSAARSSVLYMTAADYA